MKQLGMLLFALIIMRRMVTTSVVPGKYKRKEFASAIKKSLKCRKQYRELLRMGCYKRGSGVPLSSLSNRA
jgi:hypothetical protein